MKILTICPTYNRPKLCKQMTDSWHNAIGEENTLVLGIDVGDPSFLLYDDKRVNKVICKANSTVTEVLNSIWAQYPDYDYYHIINDDVLFHTKNYDSKMVYVLEEYGGGVSYGNDLFQGENLPTFPFISSKLCKTVGWLQFPLLNRYCGDTIWGDISSLCNCRYYMGEIIIEHLHGLVGKGDTQVDMPVYQKDLTEYLKWVRSQRNFDVMKIKEALNGAS